MSSKFIDIRGWNAKDDRRLAFEVDELVLVLSVETWETLSLESLLVGVFHLPFSLSLFLLPQQRYDAGLWSSLLMPKPLWCGFVFKFVSADD